MSTDLTTIRAELEQAQALSEEASSAPWERKSTCEGGVSEHRVLAASTMAVALTGYGPERGGAWVDAELIAAYRSLTPKLAGAMLAVLDKATYSLEQTTSDDWVRGWDAACEKMLDLIEAAWGRAGRMSKHTPNTEAVREQYTGEQPPHIGTVSEKEAEFDRWHAEVIRAAKAEGWDELSWQLEDELPFGVAVEYPNPYRGSDDER